MLTGGTWVETEFGEGLRMNGDPQGFTWGYAGLITHPYTIEMVFVPWDMSDYEKLFGFDSNLDNGWYLDNYAFEAWPHGSVGSGFTRNTRHYLAIVSTSSTNINVYLNGNYLGSLSASFTAPPGAAIFFRDDTATGRSEYFSGVAEAVRISNTARSVSEMDAIQTRLDSQPFGG